MFSSILRAQVSLAWVIGPPLAYALAMGFSFTVMCTSAAVAFVVCGVMVLAVHPMSKKTCLSRQAVRSPAPQLDATRCYSFVICTLMWGTNSLYIINMPLFLSTNCICGKRRASWWNCRGAGNPNLLIAGYFAEASGQTPVDENRRCRRFFLYAGMLLALSGDIATQLLNAIYIGILGGIGMLYFRI